MVRLCLLGYQWFYWAVIEEKKKTWKLILQLFLHAKKNKAKNEFRFTCFFLWSYNKKHLLQNLGKSIQVPEEKRHNTGFDSSFQHDKILVYYEAQARLHYMITLHLQLTIFILIDSSTCKLEHISQLIESWIL